MSPGIPTKVIAASSGLCGFAVGLIAGLAADNPAEVVLGRALLAMFACQLVGWVVGTIGERIVRDAIVRYRDSHPVNSSSTSSPGLAVEIPRVSPAPP